MSWIDNAFALVIGIADYKYVRKLRPAVLKDAQGIYKLLIDPQRGGYKSDNVKLLLDNQATQTSIRQSLKNLATYCNEESNIFFYFSGHGGQIKYGPHSGEYLLPVDTIYPTDKSLSETAISDQEFTELLRAIPAHKALVIFDCCHAGGIGEPKDNSAPLLKQGLSERYYDILQAGKGCVIMASSLSTEVSWILPKAENSLFTQHLLKGLSGGIPSADGFIRVFNLFEYIQPRVTIAQPNQHPYFKAQLQDNFPVALNLGGKKSVSSYIEQDYLYDAYVSFVDKGEDRKWVREILLPRLRDAGIRVVISRDVEEPGVSRLVSRERGMTQAKRTITVLSNEYLVNNWTTIENIMMQDRGIRRGEYLLLPIRIEPIDEEQLPERLAILGFLDFTNTLELDYEFERLINALRKPIPRILYK